MFKSIIFLLVFCSLFTHAQEQIEKPEFAKYYQANGVDGCFLLFDMQAAKTYIYNKSKADSGFIPASSFKILNSLIFLETGVLPDEKQIVQWDSVKRSIKPWNKSQNLKEAFANSTVWMYQKCAREVGEKKMQSFLTRSHYGNENTGGGIDRFWLDGKLRISPREQMDFLIRFYNEELPFSKRAFAIVKDIFIYQQNDSLIYRGKTGWGTINGVDYGWWVGYITISDRVYFFVNFVENYDSENQKFASARKNITEEILREMKILQ